MTGFYHLADGPTWEVISRETDLKNFHLLQTFADRDIFWANVGWEEQHWQLPKGHQGYIVMAEGPEITWLENQAQIVDAPIIVLGMVNHYDYHHPNLIYVPWIEWHYQTQDMLDAFDWKPKTRCTHLVSSLSARVTQNKIWSTMALIRHIAHDSALISISDVVEMKNVHDWNPTGNQTLDDLTQEYRQHLLGKRLAIDDFQHQSQHTRTNHDYTSRAYRDAVFNITNESWHYSFKQTSTRQWVYPGPFLTEKTMKCLLSETAVIANGQFDTYRTLESLGMEFDYGLDLSYDTRPGNIDRAVGMVNLLADLDTYDLDHWIDRTWDSRKHNREHIVRGDFYSACESINLRSLESMKQVLR